MKKSRLSHIQEQERIEYEQSSQSSANLDRGDDQYDSPDPKGANKYISSQVRGSTMSNTKHANSSKYGPEQFYHQQQEEDEE